MAGRHAAPRNPRLSRTRVALGTSVGAVLAVGALSTTAGAASGVLADAIPQAFDSPVSGSRTLADGVAIPQAFDTPLAGSSRLGAL
ncbi:hypothetical protein [Streptomyces sp. NPDC051016]|uniref:hypothetical protein n=1 Tax=Streptomyces sp. NPDC051016 TaxID=3365638 RepID=UPI0037B50DDA